MLVINIEKFLLKMNLLEERETKLINMRAVYTKIFLKKKKTKRMKYT